MNIAICEDHPGDKTLLRSYIQTYFTNMGYAGEVCSYDTGEALLADFSPGKFDILLLDIFLPGISGVEVAREIRLRDQDCLLIFITVSLDHAMDGFEVQASGYVVKPLNQEKISKALYMCREVLARSARAITIPNGRGGYLSLPLANIQYVEVYGKFSVFHMHGGLFETRLSLDEIEQAFGEGPFLRCHRSYIVNMNHIKEICADDFLMKNNDRVPMRKNGRKEVRIAFARFMAGRTANEMEGVNV